jgi:hypothetical protein
LYPLTESVFAAYCDGESSEGSLKNDTGLLAYGCTFVLLSNIDPDKNEVPVVNFALASVLLNTAFAQSVSS